MKARKLKTTWTQGLDQKEKEAFELAFRNSPIPERLEEIVNKRLQESLKTSESDYDSPSWAYHQADRNGFIRGLEYVLNLIKTN